jgi:CheY-like chemotaxis protein
MPYTLLLADDSVTIQRVIELTFASEDISVVAFSDGEHAMASIDRSPPDIVLADIDMPGRSGYEMARHIKRTPALAHIPVLLLTGAFDPVDQTKAAEAGCDGVLVKPFEPQLVINRVKELLMRARPGSKEAEVESYFEELDHAFATLVSADPAASGSVERSVVEPDRTPASDRAAQSAVKSEEKPEVPRDARPAVMAADTSEVPWAARSAVESASTLEPPRAPRPVVESRENRELTQTPRSAEEFRDQPETLRTQHPPLADAFAALLAAERSGSLGIARPAIVSPATPAPPSEELVEQVVRRILEHLSHVVSREAVTEIVHATAERLVREEIERIKSNIK